MKTKLSLIVFSAFCLTVAFSHPALAAPGDLDPSFGTGGLVRQDVAGSGDSSAAAVALQADGKIVTAGTFLSGLQNDSALLRFDPNGLLDMGFGVDGVVLEDFGVGSNDFVSAAILQPDGKAVLAGTVAKPGTNDFLLARFGSDGALDPGFGAGGVVTTDVMLGQNDEGSAVLLQPDGKIVVLGTTGGSNADFALIRYEADGAVDAGFGAGGRVTTDVLGSESHALAAALQPDGKIVVGGFAFNGTEITLALVRYRADGSLDTGFGANGVFTLDFAMGSVAATVAVQADGKILVGGSGSPDGINFDFLLIRLNEDGVLDAGFGSAGIVSMDVGGGDAVTQVLLQEDGKILAAGYAFNGTDYDFALARFNADGGFDASFGGDGSVLSDFGSGNDYALGVFLQPDGKIVLAGKASNGADADLALARFQGNTADVGVSQSVDAESVTLGKNITFTITVSNQGPDASGLVTVTDDLPSALAFVSAGSTKGTCSDGVPVTCELGTMENGETVTITLVATANALGVADNTATADPGQAVDPENGNNSSTASTEVEGAGGGCSLIR